MSSASTLESLLGAELAGGCCPSLYDSPAVHWLLGDDLHPGGEALSRRLAHLSGLAPESRVLDVASGRGRTACLLASEFGAEVTAVELCAQSVEAARVQAEAAGLAKRVQFVKGDAAALPVANAAFDSVFCECALCLFANKADAVAEMRRVLRPGGVVAISDVTAAPDDLPQSLRGVAGTVACLAEALPRDGYEALLRDAGFQLVAGESHDDSLAALAERVEYRLRAARMLSPANGYADAIAEALELAREASRAIAQGSLGYRLFVARSTAPPGSAMAGRGDGRASAALPAAASADAGRSD